MNQQILSFLIIFLFSLSSLFSDFDLPFPNGSTKRKPIRLAKGFSEPEVGTQRSSVKKGQESKQSDEEIFPKKENTRKQISPIEPIIEVKSKVVTTQNQGDAPKQEGNGISNFADQKVPEFSRGIYISQRTLKKVKAFEELRRRSKMHGINFLVIDVQPTAPSKETLDSLFAEGFYPVARVVNFDGGLPTENPSDQKIKSIHRSIRAACQSGFPEIQLDYIRYADNLQLKLSYEARYKNISGIIKNIRNETLKCENLPYIGADIFGRIPFNQNDSIGQKVEVFAQVVDVLYPMLYPSHFYGMPARIKDPYQTVYDGTRLTLKRSLKTTRVIPYIQGFNMSVAKSGLSLSDYIKAQVKATYDSGAHGFVVWNAWNEYDSTFQALTDYEREVKKGGN